MELACREEQGDVWEMIFWLIVGIFIGAFLGMFVFALLHAAELNDEDYDAPWWKDGDDEHGE